MSTLTEVLSLAPFADTLGGIIITGLLAFNLVLLRGVVTNHGTLGVAKINSETALATAAIATLTTALEVLQDENKKLAGRIMYIESEMERLIDQILAVMKAADDLEGLEERLMGLQDYLKSIGKWQY